MKKILSTVAVTTILLSGSVAMADVMQINIDSMLVDGRRYNGEGVPLNTLPTDPVAPLPQILTPNTYKGTDGVVDSNSVGHVANILNLTNNTYFFKDSAAQELTFVISGIDDVRFDPIIGTLANLFSLGIHVNVYGDMAPNYNVFDGTGATEGTLLLSLAGHAQTDPAVGGPFDLTEVYNFGTGEYTGSALLDVVGGTWASDWDTNTLNLGSDMAFSFSLDPATHGQYSLSGTANGFGASPVPEPASMLLFGTGLIGAAGIGRRKFRAKKNS